MQDPVSNERRYFDVLRRIAKDYQTTTQMRRNCEREYGLPFEEVLEMAYDNLQAEAAGAIKGKRAPK